MTDLMDLERDEVHCWYVDLDVPAETVAGCSEILASDERRRSARFRFDRDRRRFIVAHGVLRTILGRYLDTDPRRLRFVHNAFGKPELGPGVGRRVSFNLSHSAELAVVAVAHAEVGVDVERVRALPECYEIAQICFTAAEVDRWKGPLGNLRTQAFFTCWTRMEAYAKARGDGLAIPPAGLPSPDSIDPAHVPVDPCDASADAAPDGQWSLHDLRPAPGYVGALAVERSGRRLKERRWRADLPASVPGGPVPRGFASW